MLIISENTKTSYKTCWVKKPKTILGKALTSVAQLVGRRTTKQKVASLIPSQGICPDGGSGPQSGHI